MISLVCATKGRTEEVQRLLHSIATQDYRDLEVIVVDQNPDDRLCPIILELNHSISIIHFRVEPKGVSAARNAGFVIASGDSVSFPDDDCWYPPGLLKEVQNWFESHPDYSILATGCYDEVGFSTGNRWFRDRCDITPSNSLRSTMCSTLFFKCSDKTRTILFDESMHQGEDTDFALRQLKTGVKGRLDRRLHIYHPRRDCLSGTITADRARKYGMGMGVLTRRYCNVAFWVALLGYDVLRAALICLSGRFKDAAICLAHTRGLVTGYLQS